MKNFVLTKAENIELSQRETSLLLRVSNNGVRIISICPMCGASVVITVPKEKFMLVIEAIMFSGINDKTLPFLQANERETLNSGICESCFDKLYKQ